VPCAAALLGVLGATIYEFSKVDKCELHQPYALFLPFGGLLFVPRFCCINACLCLAETCTVWRLALSASQRPRTDLHSSISLCFCSCCSAPPALPGLDHVCGGEPLQLLLCISLHMLPSNAAFVVPLAGWLCGLADLMCCGLPRLSLVILGLMCFLALVCLLLYSS
jgi:hypothetical protein